MEEVAAAVGQVLRFSAIAFDAVKHLLLCSIERRPPKLDLENYPHLLLDEVALTRAGRLPGVASGGPVMDTARVLLEHHLKQLRSPTVTRELPKPAEHCAKEGATFKQFLLRLLEQETLDRERRATERRIRAARFPVSKSPETYDFLAPRRGCAILSRRQASVATNGAALVTTTARCQSPERRNTETTGLYSRASVAEHGCKRVAPGADQAQYRDNWHQQPRQIQSQLRTPQARTKFLPQQQCRVETHLTAFTRAAPPPCRAHAPSLTMPSTLPPREDFSRWWLPYFW